MEVATVNIHRLDMDIGSIRIFNVAGYRWKLPRVESLAARKTNPFGGRITRLLNGSVRTPSEAIN